MPQSVDDIAKQFGGKSTGAQSVDAILSKYGGKPETPKPKGTDSRFLHGMYETTIGPFVETAKVMEKHPVETMLFGPLGPLVHEGINSFIQSTKTAFDSHADPKERGLAAMSMIPGAGMATDVTRKALAGDEAGLAGMSTGAILSFMLGKLAAGKLAAGKTPGFTKAGEFEEYTAGKTSLPDIPMAARAALERAPIYVRLVVKMYDAFRKTGKVPKAPETMAQGRKLVGSLVGPNDELAGGVNTPLKPPIRNIAAEQRASGKMGVLREKYPEAYQANPQKPPADVVPIRAEATPRGMKPGSLEHGEMVSKPPTAPATRTPIWKGKTDVPASPRGQLKPPGSMTAEAPEAEAPKPSSPRRTGTQQRGGPGGQLARYQDGISQSIVKYAKQKGLSPKTAADWAQVAKLAGHEGASSAILQKAAAMHAE